MKLSNEIVLRPRFSLQFNRDSRHLKSLFEDAKQRQSDFKISCVDDHIFIKLPQKEQHFWSPQLHLELEETKENSCLVKGFFGPNPTVWTMFIFLHVVVGILFLVNATWLYSNYSLGNYIGVQIGIAVALIIMWILLYFAGTIGKQKGKPDMRALFDFTISILPQEDEDLTND
ncbi:GTP-binding protein [Marixanthomonas spongiae]|uniref:GTP-binding protein n=1 Tax=Marixanthomonas spongiae TaxID=2174845 RepID=A0A2U0I7Q9_9FLAO|nr:GTP-binding protein [Marixanthomonas spongiae]PVW17131.1 GTP-binding protein [Marixanthomonas spongiae]